MSFLSDILPLWNRTGGEEAADQELGRVREQPKTWTAVKLPSIPIELSEEIPPTPIPPSRPCSTARAVRTATKSKRDAPMENCLFCSNQACRINQESDGGSEQEKGRKSRAGSTIRPRRQRDFELNPPKKTVFGGSRDTQTEISPRFLLQPNVHVQSSCKGDAVESPERSSSWEPFSCECQFCGKKFGKHSVAIHEKRCNKRKQYHSSVDAPKRPVKLLKEPQKSILTRSEMPQKIATIVTVGLNSGIEKSTVYATLPSRPQTRTLQHSTLRSSGYGIPLATKDDEKFRETGSDVQCEHCQQIIAADRISTHSRLCKPSVPAVSPCDLVFPSANNLMRINKSQQTANVKHPPAQKPRKPPTKVCYICGREFGSHSIAIHEPQCLKKWQAENKKLPISQRKPIPKKRESTPTIVRTLSGEAMGKIERLPDNKEGLKEKLVQLYFENCYAEFEKELIPCKKCNRTFAPERHKMHEQNCNAEPIPQAKKKIISDKTK